VSPVDDILRMAENQEKAALGAIEAGRRHGFDATRQAMEYADIARLLRLAAGEMRHMDPATQQDYAHRMKAAVWRRLDDSPEEYAPEEMHP
jgi:hypothetical protein